MIAAELPDWVKRKKDSASYMPGQTVVPMPKISQERHLRISGTPADPAENF